ncbi:MAG: hypothetical protein JO061_14315, partial [Acidobacteriaceae bacterium]|nr:hypothetical protein [Acidobacteriaceae bacterium]
RAIDEREQRTRRWAAVFYFSLGCGVLLKGLIGLVFPLGICLVWLAFQKRLLDARVWRNMRPLMGLGIFVAVAAPWHILAILRNPPYFDLTLHADPHFGQKFRGFFWFYFINDQFLRFTNGRWPRDYNTVPRVWFWLYHLVWFFPWSFYLVGLRPAQFSEPGRLSRLRTMCLVWIGVIMLFFSLSTTQEYYSMPIYPALALLIGTAMTGEHRTIVRAARAAGVLTSLACAACVFLIVKSWGLPTPGDISDTLRQNPDMYTLALGHMTDLTFTAFAYLRLPLAIAAVAFLIGTVFLWSGSRSRIYIGSAVMLVFFFQAARLALVVFDPYMSSYTLASALIAAQAAGRDPEVVQGPAKDGKRSGESVVRGSLQPAGPGTVIFNGQYYDFSSIPYYASCSPLLLNGRVNNLEYGSYAPDAPHVFISNDDFVRIWSKPERAFVVTYDAGRKNLEDLVGRSHLVTIAESGGKQLLTNSELSVRDDLRKDSRP